MYVNPSQSLIIEAHFSFPSPYCIRQIDRKPFFYPAVSWNSNLPAMFSACQRSYRQVMFSVVSVHQSVILFHVTITCEALDLTAQGPRYGTSLDRDPPPLWTWNLTGQRPPWDLVAIPRDLFRLVRFRTPYNWSCHLLVIKVATVGVSGQYASYLNTSLLRMFWAYFNYFQMASIYFIAASRR